jgi:hypothetical protein
MRYDIEFLTYEAGRLVQPDGTIRLPKGMDRVLRDLAIEQGALMYILAACLAAKQSLTSNLLTSHMVSDEAIRRAIGVQGQISGIDLVLTTIVELMQPEPVAVEPELPFAA